MDPALAIESDWQRTCRAVVTELPAVDTLGAGGGVRMPDRASAHRWPAPPDEAEALRKQLLQDPLRRTDAQLYQVIGALNRFEWFARLSETITFAIAGSMRPESFLKSELAIIGGVQPADGAGGGGASGAAADGSLRGGRLGMQQQPSNESEGDGGENDEHFFLVLSGLLSLQYGRRVAGYLWPGQLWASFAAAARSVGGIGQKPLEVRAIEGSTVLVVTRSLFVAAMAARSGAHFRAKLEFLMSVPLLSGLGRTALRPFVDKLSEERVHKGAVLARQGDPPSKLQFVVAGEARVLRHVPEAAFVRAAEEAAASPSRLDALGDGRHASGAEAATGAEVGEEEEEDGWPLRADEEEVAAADAARSRGAARGGGVHPLERAGQTLEVARLGPRSFFGEVEILASEAAGVRAPCSVVSLTDMRLLTIDVTDFKNTADSQMLAALRAHARSHPRDTELIAMLAEGAHWRAYKRRLVGQMVAAQRGGPLPPALHRPARAAKGEAPSAEELRIRRKYYVCPDGFRTPVLRSALFDMAVNSARKAAARPPPPPHGVHRRGERQPPMLSLPDIANGVNDSAARAGIAHAGSRMPNASKAAAKAGGAGKRTQRSGSVRSAAAHWVDAAMGDKFNDWGASEAVREDYKLRFEKHLADASEMLARQSLEAV